MKTYLITGASKGIGLATSHFLNDLGHQVIGIARNPSSQKYPGQLYSADLSSSTEAKGIFTQIKQQHEIDGIVNNVGFAMPELIEDVNLDHFTSVIDINTKPALLALQTFLPTFKAKKKGRIVNIASRAILGKPGRSSYSAAKAALIALTRTWALELAPINVTVNAVAPGPISTEAYFANYPPDSPEYKKSIASIPLGRIGETKDVANAIAFFLNEDSSFITGQTLFVDGGKSIASSSIF